MTVEATRADQLASITARWVLGLFLLYVLLQRLAVPATDVALLLPAVLAWCLYGLRQGIVVVDRGRSTLFLAAFGAMAAVVALQNHLVPRASISITSYGLFMVVWSPFVLRLVDGRPQTYVRMLRLVVRVGLCLAAACLVMTLSQLAGLGYRDWFGALVPDVLELQGFVITYPVAYGSDLYRANAWIGLEPSFVSAQLGLALIAGLYARASSTELGVLIAAMGCTLSGSGFALVVVAVLVVLASPLRRVFVRHLPVLALSACAAATTSFGLLLLDRVTEFQSAGSSTSLRALEPYLYLWPAWIEDDANVLLGLGPGSAQDLITDTQVLGLLVPSPAKIFFEYGLLGGVVLAGFLLACYVAGPSRGFAASLLVSLWLLQPGTTTLLAIAPLLIFVTLWSPRPGAALESNPGWLAEQRRPALRWRRRRSGAGRSGAGAVEPDPRPWLLPTGGRP